jgi:acetyl-CoA carboxylase carboxyltransferase component
MADDQDKSSSGNDDKANSSERRLSQVVGHLDSSSSAPRKRRTPKSKKNELPPDYSDILGQLKTLRAIAATPDLKSTGYVRQKQAGKLWVRERVEQIFDQGSFQEVGSVSGTVQWKKLGGVKEEPVGFTPSNNVQGFGTLRGRRVVFTADDFSIRAGHADGALMEKTIYMEKLAISLRLPILKLVDGSSGGGSVTTIKVC